MRGGAWAVDCEGRAQHGLRRPGALVRLSKDWWRRYGKCVGGARFATPCGAAVPPRVHVYMGKRNIQQLFAAMWDVPPEGEFYSITIGATEEDGPFWSVCSHWTGWADEERLIELRAASLVSPSLMKQYLQFGQPCVAVHCAEQLLIYFRYIGGHALVARQVAEQFLPDMLTPHPCGRDQHLGFTSIRDAPVSVLLPPSPELRAKVLARDGLRCRSCHRESSSRTGVGVLVRHIRLQNRGGVTTEGNLITLCSRCCKRINAKGFMGDEDLAALTSPVMGGASVARDHATAVRIYRQLAAESFSHVTTPKRQTKSTSRASGSPTPSRARSRRRSRFPGGPASSRHGKAGATCLSGKQMKVLHAALVRAFPNEGDLTRLVRFELDVELDVIVGRGALNERVFELINWAERSGRVQDLVHAARREKPDNSDLVAFAESVPWGALKDDGAGRPSSQ